MTTQQYNTLVTYTGDGSTITYSIPFPYLLATDVKAEVDGVIVPCSASGGFVTLASPPAAGKQVRFWRQTGLTGKRVDFTDGAVITEADLDKSATQAFYMGQEAFDQAQIVLGDVTSVKVLKDTIIAETTALKDNAYNSAVSAAASAANALGYKDSAFSYATLSASARDAAEAAKTAAQASQTAAATSETNAGASAAAAAASDAAALSWRNSALTASVTSQTKAIEASDSATAAAASAASASANATGLARFQSITRPADVSNVYTVDVANYRTAVINRTTATTPFSVAFSGTAADGAELQLTIRNDTVASSIGACSLPANIKAAGSINVTGFSPGSCRTYTFYYDSVRAKWIESARNASDVVNT